MSSDERLVRRAAQGDSRAFEAIYRRYHQDLYRFCLAMLGNPQDAQDALQNTMVKVLRALPGEKREVRLKPWLYRIARNESVETLRKRRDSAPLEPHLEAVGGVSEVAETRARLRTLLTDLEQLPERQRAVLVMRELSGLGFDQIGAALVTSPAVARQTLYEARLSLRRLEAGREMRCDEVMRELSDADGRVTRRREIRAHLRSCAECRAFRDGIAKRHQDFAGLSPLPLALSAALFQGALAKGAVGGAATVGSGLAGGVGAGVGQAVATSAVVKSVATVAVVAVVGVSAADRGGLVDLPLPGGGFSAGQSAAEPGHAAGTIDAKATGAGSRQANANRSPQAGSKPDRGDTANRRGNGGTPTQDVVDTPAPGPGSSNAQAGMTPPGGGHGRSASGGQDPETLPDAAAHGQQIAATKKPGHAAIPPGSGSAGSRGKQPEGSPPAAKPTPPSDEKAPTAPPASTAAPRADEGPAQQGSSPMPPGLQR